MGRLARGGGPHSPWKGARCSLLSLGRGASTVQTGHGYRIDSSECTTSSTWRPQNASVSSELRGLVGGAQAPHPESWTWEGREF